MTKKAKEVVFYKKFYILLLFQYFLHKELSESKIEKGIILDIAKKHYYANSIKKIIKKISGCNGELNIRLYC